MRTVHRWAPDVSQYCQEECQSQWEPLLAPAGAKVNIASPSVRNRSNDQTKTLDDGTIFYLSQQNVPDWTVIEGPQGLQWVYKGWHMVYRRKGDEPGSTAYDGAEEFTWNTLKFIPPAPEFVAPETVSVARVDGEYYLADEDGRILFTGACAGPCREWEPLAGGLASRGVGEWAVWRAGETPQWTYSVEEVGLCDDRAATRMAGKRAPAPDQARASPLIGVIFAIFRRF